MKYVSLHHHSTNSYGDKMITLIEEVGEVARALTYDEKKNKEELYKELIQVAALAVAWAEGLVSE